MTGSYKNKYINALAYIHERLVKLEESLTRPRGEAYTEDSRRSIEEAQLLHRAIEACKCFKQPEFDQRFEADLGNEEYNNSLKTRLAIRLIDSHYEQLSYKNAAFDKEDFCIVDPVSEDAFAEVLTGNPSDGFFIAGLMKNYSEISKYIKYLEEKCGIQQ